MAKNSERENIEKQEERKTDAAQGRKERRGEEIKQRGYKEKGIKNEDIMRKMMEGKNNE